MSEEARKVDVLNFDPEDPRLLRAEVAQLGVRLQTQTKTEERTPYPGTDYPGPEPESGEEVDDLAVHAAGRDTARRARLPEGRLRLQPLDIDLR